MSPRRPSLGQHPEVIVLLAALTALALTAAPRATAVDTAPPTPGFGHHGRAPIEARLLLDGRSAMPRARGDVLILELRRHRPGITPVRVALTLPAGVELREGAREQAIDNADAGRRLLRWRLAWRGERPPDEPVVVRVAYEGRTQASRLRERFAARLRWRLGAVDPIIRARPRAPRAAPMTSLGGRPLGRGRRTR